MFNTDRKEFSPNSLRKHSATVNLKNFFKTSKKSIFKSIKEFCKNSTLHGLSYLADKKLCFFERAFFAVSLVFVVIIAAFFINNVYKKWCTTPVIFSINPKPTHIKNEPFPALTLCNMNQAYKTKISKFEKNSAAYATTQILCQREFNNTTAQDIKDWSFLTDFIKEISQPCEKMILDCRYGSINYNCSHLFHPTVTDEGLCCTFNMVHPKFMYKNSTSFLKGESAENGDIPYTAVAWTPETGYPPSLPENFYPFKAAGIGESMGLHVILNVENDEYYCSTSNSIGFKMVLHSPTETPCVKEVGLVLAPAYETKARISIEKLQSDAMLKRVYVKHRQCLFEGEDDLNYYATYSQHNCLMECEANLSMHYYGCVPYFRQRNFYNETICSLFNTHSTTISQSFIPDNADNYTDIFQQCDELCLPSCSDLKYHADIFTTPFCSTGLEMSHKVLRNFSMEYIERNIAMLTVYYKGISYRSNVQTEFIDMTNVLSSVGGLIGLFFGFSFISFAEIIFYTFIRPCRAFFAQRKYKKTKNIKSSSVHSIKSFPHHFKSNRKLFKNSSIFRGSPKIITVSQALDAVNFPADQKYMPGFGYLSQDNSKPQKPQYTNN